MQTHVRNTKKLTLLAGILLILAWNFVSQGDPSAPPPSGNLVKIKNSKICLGFLPKLGAHIVFLSFNGSANLLLSDEKLWDSPPPPISAENPPFLDLNGHTTWLAPQDDWWTKQDVNKTKKNTRSPWPPDPFVTLGEYKIISVDDHSVVLEGQDSPVSGVRLTKRFALQESTVQISVTMTNISGAEQSWGLWSNTRFPGKCKAYLPCFQGVFRDLRFESKPLDPKKERLLNYIFTDDFLSFDIGDALAHPDFSNSVKAFVRTKDRSLAAFNGRYLLIKNLPGEADRVSERHAQVEIFQGVGGPFSILELEAHGNKVTLKPGESSSITEVWRLFEYNGDDSPSSQRDFLRPLLEKRQQ